MDFNDRSCDCTRRTALRTALGLPLFLAETGMAMALNQAAGSAPSERILVVIELAGGNDGLNTVIPYRNDDYYRARPTIAIKQGKAITLSDEFGLHPSLGGWERLYKEGLMGIVHACGYPNPNRSHFESMKFWQSGVPNTQEPTGWVGRFSNALETAPKKALVVNVANKQSDALRGSIHPTVTFNNPARFLREGTAEEKEIFKVLAREQAESGNSSLNFVRTIAGTADQSSDFVRTACAEYQTKYDYGFGAIGIAAKRISALISARAKTRIYYTTMGGFDTHVSQASSQAGLFNQIGDALYSFQNDMKRIGRDKDVAVLLFTEFGRRVKENASGGTDHGVGGPMFIVGKDVKGGFYGKFPGLTDLDSGDIKMTTDFRSVYATMIKEWMGVADPKPVLKADFPTLGVFA